MGDSSTQSYKNHVRFHPPFHFFLGPILLLTLAGTIWNLVRHPGLVSAWLVVLSAASIVALFLIRTYPLKVQDRLIRLEEGLRLATVLPEPLRSRIPELTERQLVALRFASDAELPALVQRTLAEQLSPDEIKRSIVQWRPDTFRV